MRLALASSIAGALVLLCINEVATSTSSWCSAATFALMQKRHVVAHNRLGELLGRNDTAHRLQAHIVNDLLSDQHICRHQLAQQGE